MKSIAIGTGALKGSRIAYGTWRLAGAYTAANLPDDIQERGVRALAAAVEAGFTLIDLADIYADGAAEIIFGRALRENPSMRGQLVVASKCGIRKKGDPTQEASYRYDFSTEHIVRSCEASLKRMGIETIDLYQLHRPDYLMNPDEVAAALAQLQKAGKIRELGVSNFSPGQLSLLQKSCRTPIVVNQVEISLLKLNAFEDGTLDQCLSEKITPMAWSPLAAGRLAEDAPIEMGCNDHKRRVHVREVLDDIARHHSVSRSVVALAWLLKHPAAIVPIIGSTTPATIQDSAKADSLDLSREEWYRLFEAARGERLP